MKKEIICGIYKITSPSGKIYIGQSPNIYTRFKVYKRLDCKRQPKIFASLCKYGVDKHIFEIIEICVHDKLNDREMYWINYYDSYNTSHGMNLTIGGGGAQGLKMSEKAKQKLREKALQRPRPREETRRKISTALKGRVSPTKGMKQSTDHISKRVAKNTGRKRSEETKQIQSQKAKGNTKWLGKKHTAESNLKRSETMKQIIANKKLQPNYDPLKEHLLRKESSKKASITRKNNPNYNSPEEIKKRKERNLKIIVLDAQYGIFYFGAEDAAKAHNLNTSTLRSKLSGYKRNNTSLISV